MTDPRGFESDEEYNEWREAQVHGPRAKPEKPESEMCRINLVISESGRPQLKLEGECNEEKLGERLIFDKVYVEDLEKGPFWKDSEIDAAELEKTKKEITQIERSLEMIKAAKRFPEREETDLEM